MFPIYKKSDIPAEIKKKRGKTLLFDFKSGEFVLKDGRTSLISGEEGLKIWIEKCLLTTKEKYLIYLQDNKPYGIPEFDLENRLYPRELLYAEIESEITEALRENKEEILNVDNFDFKQQNKTLVVAFDVKSIYGQHREVINWTF